MMSSQKRAVAQEVGEEEEGRCFVQEPKRPRSFRNVVREALNMQYMQGLSLELEPFIRKVVNEEVQKSLSRRVYPASRPLLDKIQTPTTTHWRLHFKSNLPDKLFTGSRIESEDKTPITIVIKDSNSGMIITSGPLSSVRVEIVVIDDDFCGGQPEDSTQKEFADNVVHARDGKRPLLIGDRVNTLRGGIGEFADLNFTDNSSWRRTRKFRLGARVLPGNCIEERIQEAISGAFLVKDHRGEFYKKHHPPSLHDPVWRLEKIAKDGAFHKRLSQNGIKTVQEFLKFLAMDQNQLRSMLGNGMSNRTWETITEHAQDCLIDEKLYSYYIMENQVMLIFDSIFRVVGVKFDHSEYQQVSCLPRSQMSLVDRLKQVAYRNRNNITEFEPPPNLPRHQTMADASVLASTLQDPPNPDFLTTIQADGQIAQMGLEHSFYSPLHPELPEDPCQQNCISMGEEITPVRFFSSDLSNYTGDSLGRSSGYYGAGTSTSRRQ